MRGLLVVAALVLVGCGSSTVTSKLEKVAPAPPPVKDNTALLLTENRVSASVVPDHLLGNKTLPGGTLGEYSKGEDKYQLFVIETASAQDAAILLLDWKGTLTNPEFDAAFGGYFGMDSGKPVFAFAKGKYLTGVAGLERTKADPVARLLAARVH
jgi:hypothetical protein